MYYIKPKILIEKISAEAIEKFPLGNKVVIITSKTVNKNYGLSDIFEILKKKHNLFVYSHIRPDAPFEDLDLVIKELKGVPLDSIIAIGGGSTIDAAKALSVAFGNVSYKDIFYGKKPMPTTKVSVLAIPTTAGTGAELSFGAIIYDKENGKKGGIRGEIVQPDYVLIDANLHNGCPKSLKAEVGFDCLTHAIETYISKKSTPIIRIQSVNCINTIFRHLEPACKADSLEDMQKVAIASTLMGINLAFSSTCLPHRIQYVIGPLTGTSHAKGLIALYRGWLDHSLSLNLPEWYNLMKDLGMNSNTFLNKIQYLKKELEIDYSIQDLGIKQDQIKEISDNVTGNMTLDPSYKDKESIINILKKSI